MLIYVKIIKKKKKKFFIGRTDGRTHVQLKTIVRNLTKKKLQKKIITKKKAFHRQRTYGQNCSSEPYKKKTKKSF